MKGETCTMEDTTTTSGGAQHADELHQASAKLLEAARLIGEAEGLMNTDATNCGGCGKPHPVVQEEYLLGRELKNLREKAAAKATDARMIADTGTRHRRHKRRPS